MIGFFALGSLFVWINDAWLYDPFGVVDQWAYIGLEYHFPNLIRSFPTQPAGELIGLIGPNAIIYHFLSPLMANKVIGISSFTIVLVLIFFLLDRNVSRRSAIFTTLLLSQYQFFLLSIGSSYTEGRTMVFFTIVLFLLDRASFAIHQRKRNLYLGLAGFFYFMCLNTAILSLVYGFPLLVYYFIMRKGREGQNIFLNKYSDFFSLAMGFFLGFFIVYVTYLKVGIDKVPMKNNIEKLFWFFIGGLPTPHLSQWLPSAIWLIFPLSILVTYSILMAKTILLKSKRLSQFELGFASLFFSLVGLLCFTQFVLKQYPLQLLYFHQTLPVYFLCLGLLISPLISQLNSITFFLYSTALFSLGAATLWIHNNIDFHRLVAGRPIIILALLVFSLSIIVFISGSKTIANIGLTIFITAFSVLNLVNFVSILPNMDMNHSPAQLSLGLKNSKQNFLATLTWCDYIDVIDPKRSFLLWYNDNSNIGALIRQFSAPTYLYQAMQFNRVFPSVSPGTSLPGNSGGTTASVGQKILIISEKSDAEELADENLRKVGLSLKVERKDQFIFKTIHLYTIQGTFINNGTEKSSFQG